MSPERPDKPGSRQSPHAETSREIATHLRRRGRHDEALGLLGHLLRTAAYDSVDIQAYVDCAGRLGHDPLTGLTDILARRQDADLLRDYLIRSWRARRADSVVRDLVVTAPGSRRADWLLAAAEAAMRLGRSQEAEGLYRAAGELDGGQSGAASGLARIRAQSRQFDAVLEELDRIDDGDDVNLSEINLRVSANRRLGRQAGAAAAAATGLRSLMAAGKAGDAARLLDRNGFSASALVLKRALVASEDMTAIRRLAGQTLGEGRISEAVGYYRAGIGKNWANRLNPRHRERLEQLSALFVKEPGVGSQLDRLEGGRLITPDSLLLAIADMARETRAEPFRESRRVVMVTGTLGPGGAERQLVLTAKGLAASYNATVDVVTLQDPNAAGNAHQRPALEALDIRVRDLFQAPSDWVQTPPLRCGHIGGLAHQLPPRLRQQLLALCHVFVRSRPALVHGWQDVTGALSAIAALLTGVPRVVIGARSLAPDRKEGRNRPWLRAVMAVLLKDPRVRLVNNSRSGAQDYARWLAMRDTDIALVPNGFDLAAFSPSESDPATRRLTIGGVMRLTEEKRPELWLETVAALRQAGYDVAGRLVGDGPMMPHLVQRRAELGMEADVDLVGRRTEMAAEYHAMDILLLTSHTEGLPNVLVEAQACGLPVVATQAGGAAETFVDGTTGVLVTEATMAGLSAALRPLVQDPAMRHAMGRAAIDHVTSEFGLERMIARTARVYGWEAADNG